MWLWIYPHGSFQPVNCNFRSDAASVQRLEVLRMEKEQTLSPFIFRDSLTRVDHGRPFPIILIILTGARMKVR